MIPAQFDYQAPSTIDEALTLLAANPDEAKILAGGHSLIPAMKLRLAQPALLVDIGRIKNLSYIREEGDQIRIGTMTTHYQLESSSLLKKICPLLPECASHIGDVQVLHAEGRQRINNRAHDRRRRSDRARFTDAFDAQRINRRRRLRTVQLHPRNVRRPGQRVVHQTAGD